MAVRRADAAKNREHLLRIASALHEERGAVPALNDLAKRAGLGVGTVYRHFPDQAALLAGLASLQLERFAAVVEAAERVEDPFDALSELFHGVVRLELESRALAQLMSTPMGAPDDVRARLEELARRCDAIVARAKKAKQLRAALKPSDFRRLVCGVALAARSGDAPERAAQRYVAVILEGLRAR